MIYVVAFLAISIGIGTGIIMLTSIINAIRHVPYVPTAQKVVEQMVTAANLKPGQTVYDLGCGDGRLLRQALQTEQVNAVGIEVSWMVYQLARIRQKLSKASMKLIHGNFFQHDLSEADIIFCYLIPRVMEKLKEKFSNELQEGCQVISYSFPIKGWTPSRTLQTRADKPKNFLIYCYDIPRAYSK